MQWLSNIYILQKQTKKQKNNQLCVEEVAQKSPGKVQISVKQVEVHTMSSHTKLQAYLQMAID